MNEPLRFVFIDGDDPSANRASLEASSVSSSTSIYSADDLCDVVELRALRRSTSAYDSVSASVYDAVDANLTGVHLATAPHAAASTAVVDADGYTDQFDETIPM